MDEYSGWFREVPREQRPDWAQREVENVQNQEKWNAWALRRLPQWQAMAHPRPGHKQAPCMGIGIYVDDELRRYARVAISGDGSYTQEMIDALQQGEEFALDLHGEDLHAEQRLARTAVWMREQNDRAAAAGRPLPHPPGIRLEAVAASFPICRKRCVPELRREGTQPLTKVEPEPTQPQPPQRNDPRPTQGFDPTQTQRRGRKPKR